MAISVGTTTCSLAKAFSDIALSEASRNGGVLPFTVLSFTNASGAPSGGTTTSQLLSSSKRWREHNDSIDAAIARTTGEMRFHQSRGETWAGDIPAGCTHYVVRRGQLRGLSPSAAGPRANHCGPPQVCDCVTRGQMDIGATGAFRNAFVQRMTVCDRKINISLPILTFSFEISGRNSEHRVSNAGILKL